MGAEWAGGAYSFKANTASFVSYVNEAGLLSLSATDYEWWIAFAASQWRVESGAAIDLDYTGTTNVACTDNNDTINSVGAVSSCGASCTALAVTTFTSSSGYFTEVDICVRGANSDGDIDWDIDGDLVEGDWDLVSTLAHEFGHALGLDHPSTGSAVFVMQTGGTTGSGNTLRRHLYGDDIEGIRTLYGTQSLGEYLRQYTASSNSVGSAFSKSGNVNTPTGGTIARDGGTWYVFRTALNTALDRVYFDSTSYQASGASSWTSYYITSSQIYPPSMGSDDQSDSVVSAVYPLAMDTYGGSCNGLRSRTSTDRFASSTSETTTDICAVGGAGITYDPVPDQWVLAYVAIRPNGGADEDEQGRIFMRTSTNGRTWSSANELDTQFYALDGPSLACDDGGDCVLSYVNAATDYPYVRSVAFTVSGSTISLGSATTGSAFIARTPAVGASSSGDFYQWISWTDQYADVANGWGTVYSRTASAPPFSSSFSSLSESTPVRPGVAHSPGRTYGYVLFAE